MGIHQSFLLKLRSGAFAPADIASLVFFRIAFGLLMVWEVCRFFAHRWIEPSWLDPQFLFKYYGFSWVHPWPGQWLYIHWAALGLFALFIAAGFLYRISAALFFLSYTYFFLLDEAWYVNHAYLICLFGFLLIFVPANHAFSVDTWLRPGLRSDTTQWFISMEVSPRFLPIGCVANRYARAWRTTPIFLSSDGSFVKNGLYMRFLTEGCCSIC
jgi:hypothetical protein